MKTTILEKKNIDRNRREIIRERGSEFDHQI